jgi:hypothetical protein
MTALSSAAVLQLRTTLIKSRKRMDISLRICKEQNPKCKISVLLAVLSACHYKHINQGNPNQNGEGKNCGIALAGSGSAWNCFSLLVHYAL